MTESHLCGVWRMSKFPLYPILFFWFQNTNVNLSGYVNCCMCNLWTIKKLLNWPLQTRFIFMTKIHSPTRNNSKMQFLSMCLYVHNIYLYDMIKNYYHILNTLNSIGYYENVIFTDILHDIGYTRRILPTYSCCKIEYHPVVPTPLWSLAQATLVRCFIL